MKIILKELPWLDFIDKQHDIISQQISDNVSTHGMVFNSIQN